MTQPLRFSASRAEMIMACHASANLELAIPGWQPPVVDDTAGAKGHGSMVHKVFENVNALPAKEIAAFAKVLTYVAELRSTRRFKVLIEPKIQATWLPSAPNTTADLVLYTQDECHVIDLKWGRIEVPVAHNGQLMYYGVSFAPLAPRAKGVTLHVLQPLIDNMESWFADTNTLREFMDEAIATDHAVTAGSTKFGPSDHCTFCPANPHSRGDKGRPFCPAMMNLLYPAPFEEDAILDPDL